MSTLVYNANDVFEIAKRIERNGAAFYRAAGEVMADAESRDLMANLAEMEVQHEAVFASMQQGLSGTETEETLYDPHDEAYAFLKGMADKYVFNPNEEPGRAVGQGAGPLDILQEALLRESDSVVFYEAIKIMVPEKYGRGRVDEIIGQEMGHIMLLNKEMERLSAKAGA
jgi:rubrerythrin